MNIKELVERLSEIAEAYPGATVMLATQPGYPIAETLRGVADPDDEAPNCHEDHSEDADGRCLDGCEGEADPVQDYSAPVVWLVSGGQSHRHDVSPYAPGWVFDAA